MQPWGLPALLIPRGAASPGLSWALLQPSLQGSSAQKQEWCQSAPLAQPWQLSPGAGWSPCPCPCTRLLTPIQQGTRAADTSQIPLHCLAECVFTSVSLLLVNNNTQLEEAAALSSPEAIGRQENIPILCCHSHPLLPADSHSFPQKFHIPTLSTSIRLLPMCPLPLSLPTCSGITQLDSEHLHLHSAEALLLLFPTPHKVSGPMAWLLPTCSMV